MRLAWVYDMNACRLPTGVTRHALAQLDQLARRPELVTNAVSGRISEPDGLIAWDALPGHVRRRELPISMRDMLRYWRVVAWPPLETWTGPIDWMYCPAEFFVPTRRARRAVTSHDVLQDLRLGSPRRRALLERALGTADLVLSVSHFNTAQLLEAFPATRDKVAYVPNAADDLFFEPAAPAERAAVRADAQLPDGMPYLLSVASFQPRKNLERLVRAFERLPEARRGALALVLVGEGNDDQVRQLREAARNPPGERARVVMPGYRQGKALRALYAESSGLVFPSLCESFGIPVVEAMAQGCPVVIADSTALPEVAGEAGWPHDPESEDAIAAAIAAMLGDPEERSRRIERGRVLAAAYRWSTSNDLLLEAIRTRTA